MHKHFGLVANHWLAKILSLLLALALWAVIHRNIKETTLPSRIQFDVGTPATDSKFDIGNSIHGERKK
jgi:YbbR domain-containing protein